MIDDRARSDPSLPRRHGRTVRVAGALVLAAMMLLEPGSIAPRVAQAAPGATGIRRAPSPADRSTLDPIDERRSRVADAGDSSSPTEPSIIALDAAAHAGDRIRFTPGGLVTVPFAPRAGDRWAVGGTTPRRLPSGAATGRAMAASRQGTVWAPGSSAPEASIPLPGPGLPRPVDGPSGPPASRADPTAYTTAPSPERASASARDLRRQVFGFLPYWELSDGSTRLQYDLLSTIAYFGVGASASGDLVKRNADGTTSVGWAGWTSSRMTSVIDEAHRHGTRVVLTVQSFAWTTGQARSQSALLGSPAARLKLARQIAAAVRDRGADGVNLDFEPLTSGRGDEFVAFVRSLRSELDKLAKGYQLTFDTTGSIGNYPIEAATAPGAADAIFIMGYDYRTAGSSVAGSVSPLAGPAYDLTDTVLAFTDRVAPGKVILGIPYYGRAWSTVSDAPNARTQSGPKYGPSASVTYVNAVELAAANGRRYDAVEASAWLAYRRKNCTTTYGCVTSWREVYYDDAQSIRAKYDLINRFGLRGAGIWALGYDGTRPELYGAIVEKFLHDTTPPETGVAVLAPTQGDEGFRVAWSAIDMSAIRDYDVQVSVDGGPWTAWRTRTTDTSAILLGQDGHRYAVRARATDAKGNVGAWDVTSLPDPTPSLARGAFGTVRSSSLSVRTRPDTSASVVGTLTAGDVVSITGGPATADGYTWYQVAGPLTTWAPVRPTRVGGWLAAKRGSTVYLAARMAPNTTLVDAGIAGLSFGSGGATSIGTSATALAARAFSPNGDGSEDGLTLRWRNGATLDGLTLRVLRVTDGVPIGSRSVPDIRSGVQVWTWDGTVGGRTLPDGHYLLQLVGRDAGRTYSAPSAAPASPDQVAAFAVTVDTGPPAIAGATVSARILSPNGDGRLDAVSVSATATGGATRWRLSAAPLSGNTPAGPVRTIVGTGPTPRASWDGRAGDGGVVPDGRYRLSLTVLDDAGNAAARTWDVTVDATPPKASLAADPDSISPDRDGTGDAALIRWTAAEPATATIQVLRGTTIVRSFAGTPVATAGARRWDGRDRHGRPVADGAYVARVVTTDAAGNRAVTTVGLRVDRTAGWLRWSPGAFYAADHDALAKSARVTFRLARAATTTLQLVDGSGTVVRTAWSGRRLRSGSVGWVWDGKDGARAFVPAGTYLAVLTARTSLGTVTLRRPILADAFATTLSAAILKAGQTLTVSFQTTEPLRGRPSVTFDQAGLRPVTRSATLVAPGRYRIAFKVAASGVGTATIRIAGRDTSGGLNATVRTVSVR